MIQKYLFKFAWKCQHEIYGEIISFVVSPYQETSPCCWGYILDGYVDEVIRFPADSIFAKSILSHMISIGNNQWEMPLHGELIEHEIDLDDYNEERFYQDNYGREVVFHTHWSCE